MSSSRMLLATPVAGLTARMGSRFSASSDWNWPSMRTSSRSLGAFSAPPASTAFWALICAMTWLMSTPICASFAADDHAADGHRPERYFPRPINGFRRHVLGVSGGPSKADRGGLGRGIGQ